MYAYVMNIINANGPPRVNKTGYAPDGHVLLSFLPINWNHNTIMSLVALGQIADGSLRIVLILKIKIETWKLTVIYHTPPPRDMCDKNKLVHFSRRTSRWRNNLALSCICFVLYSCAFIYSECYLGNFCIILSRYHSTYTCLLKYIDTLRYSYYVPTI